MPSLTLHHLNKSRSHRILWLLEELELEYTLQEYKRDADFRAPPELKKVHPLGKSPALTIDGVTYAETGAIIETVIEGPAEGRLGPTNDSERAQFRYFLHYAEGSLMPPLLVSLLTSKLRTAPFPLRLVTAAVGNALDSKYTTGELTSHGAFLEKVLADRAHFAGETFTAADIQMSYPVQALVERSGLDLPHSAEWLSRMQARPAYQAAVTKGGPVFPKG